MEDFFEENGGTSQQLGLKCFNILDVVGNTGFIILFLADSSCSS